MRFSLRDRLSRSLLPVALASLSLGCMGRADLLGSDSDDGGPSSSGSSSGGSSGSSSGGSSGSSSGGPTSSSSSSGGTADPDCSLLELPDLARVCPDGTSVGGQYVLSNHECVLEFPCPPPISPPPSGDCSQGATCSPGSGCGTATPVPLGSVQNCETSCMCDGTGHFQCTTGCSSPPTGCTQGASCSPGSGCGGGGSSSGGPGGDCFTDCECNPNGLLECNTVCEDASPPPITDVCPGYPVPDICEVCPNGVTECAHAILVNGECETEICPGS
jgi:hypothetical protein